MQGSAIRDRDGAMQRDRLRKEGLDGTDSFLRVFPAAYTRIRECFLYPGYL